MKSKKIFNRLLTSFIIVLSMLIIIAVVGIVGLVISKTKQDEAYNNQLHSIKQAGEINNNFLEAGIYLNKIVVAAIAEGRDKVNQNIEGYNKYISEMDAALEVYRTELAEGVDETVKFDAVYNSTQKYKNLAVAILTGIDAALNDDNAPILTAIESAAPVRTETNDAINDLIAFNAENAKNNNDDSSLFSTIFIGIMIGLTVIGIGTTVLLVLFLCIGIERDLKTIVSKLIVSTNTIDKATTQLNEASENLAGGSSKQAASLEETSATMNESASMISQNAENTRQATQIARQATDLSNVGMKKMDEMVISMDQIKESSDTISRIVKVIDDIAFQTNLLAINATVEAARAGGDAGRSFAVVAEEVRNLAQRSAKAASDTTDIIEKNISLTANGRDVSRNVSESLKEITKQTESLSRIINEINAASEEQATGIKQINIALSQMEKVTQDNAAVAEENAASTQSMKTQIENLQNAVSIAEGIIRDPSSIKEYIDREADEQGISKTNYSSMKKTSYAEKSKSTESKFSSSSSPKSSSSSSSSSSSNSTKKSEADKIIPLDDDDNF